MPLAAVNAATTNNTITVATAAQLIAAIPLGHPILVTKSILLSQGLPAITTSVTISGDPVACRSERRGYCRIDCKKMCRIFEVGSGGALTLQTIMLSRGVAPELESSGGAIRVRSGGIASCSVVIFRFNGARGATSGGGAVEVENGGIFRALNCYFVRNFAGFGGAVAGAKSASIIVKGCFFNRNVALTAGGAVSLVLNSTATLSRNDYHGNSAAIGGAIQLDSSTASICTAWGHTNNASLVGPEVYAANNARVLSCNVPFNFVVVTSGSTINANCGLC